MEEPTPEVRDLAERVLKALREWHPGILEPTWCRAPRPNSEQDLERGFLARRLEWFLSEDPLSSALGWELLLHWSDPPANVSGGPGDAVPQPMGAKAVALGLQAKLRELKG